MMMLNMYSYRRPWINIMMQISIILLSSNLILAVNLIHNQTDEISLNTNRNGENYYGSMRTEEKFQEFNMNNGSNKEELIGTMGALNSTIRSVFVEGQEGDSSFKVANKKTWNLRNVLDLKSTEGVHHQVNDEEYDLQAVGNKSKYETTGNVTTHGIYPTSSTASKETNPGNNHYSRDIYGNTTRNSQRGSLRIIRVNVTTHRIYPTPSTTSEETNPGNNHYSRDIYGNTTQRGSLRINRVMRQRDEENNFHPSFTTSTESLKERYQNKGMRSTMFAFHVNQTLSTKKDNELLYNAGDNRSPSDYNNDHTSGYSNYQKAMVVTLAKITSEEDDKEGLYHSSENNSNMDILPVRFDRGHRIFREFMNVETKKDKALHQREKERVLQQQQGQYDYDSYEDEESRLQDNDYYSDGISAYSIYRRTNGLPKTIDEEDSQGNYRSRWDKTNLQVPPDSQVGHYPSLQPINTATTPLIHIFRFSYNQSTMFSFITTKSQSNAVQDEYNDDYDTDGVIPLYYNFNAFILLFELCVILMMLYH